MDHCKHFLEHKYWEPNNLPDQWLLAQFFYDIEWLFTNLYDFIRLHLSSPSTTLLLTKIRKFTTTVVCILFRICYFGLEARVIIKILTQAVRHNARNWQKPQKNIFACFRPYVGQPDDHIGWSTLMPFTSIYPIDPRTNSWNFRKKYWELTRKKTQLFWVGNFEFFFASLPRKSVNIYRLARMGQNFDDYPGFQPKIAYSN